jgi:hypothetical protein
MDNFAAVPQVEENSEVLTQDFDLPSGGQILMQSGQNLQTKAQGNLQCREQKNSQVSDEKSDNQPFISIKHNHSIKPLTKEEAILYAQKGIDYDRIRASHDFIAEISREEGISPEEWRNNLKKQRDDQKVHELAGQADSGTVAYRQIEQEKRLVQLEEEIAFRREQEKQIEDVAEFQAKYPEVNIDDLPDSVLIEVNSGVPLKYAYAEYAYSAAQKKLEAYDANRLNADAATGSLSGNAEVLKDFYTKDEFYRLPEIRKNQLIDSGRIYDFMSKW